MLLLRLSCLSVLALTACESGSSNPSGSSAASSQPAAAVSASGAPTAAATAAATPPPKPSNWTCFSAISEPKPDVKVNAGTCHDDKAECERIRTNVSKLLEKKGVEPTACAPVDRVYCFSMELEQTTVNCHASEELCREAHDRMKSAPKAPKTSECAAYGSTTTKKTITRLLKSKSAD